MRARAFDPLSKTPLPRWIRSVETADGLRESTVILFPASAHAR
jgi:hypothetical protein